MHTTVIHGPLDFVLYKLYWLLCQLAFKQELEMTIIIVHEIR